MPNGVTPAQVLAEVEAASPLPAGFSPVGAATDSAGARLFVANQYGEQDSKGSLEPGKKADLVILDRNPLEVDAMAIKDIKVVETIKEGRSIYARGDM